MLMNYKTPGRQRQEDCCEIKTNLGYIAVPGQSGLNSKAMPQKKNKTKASMVVKGRP